MATRSYCAFAMVFLALGCGDGKGHGGPPVVGVGGLGGGGGSDGGSAGASGGGSGGSAGSTGCEDVFHVDGTLAGTSIQGDLLHTPATFMSGFQNWYAWIVFEKGGALVIQGIGPADDGDAVQGTGYFAAPVDSFLNGQHFVAGNVSLIFGDLTQPVTLTSLSKVGDCPGGAVSGSLNVCSSSGIDSPECQDELEITGVLDTFAVSELHDSKGHLYAIEGFDGLDPVGAMYMASTDGGFLAAEGKHSGMSGLLIWPATGARAGSTLCFDAAQYVDAPQSVQIDLVGMSDVGKAADATPVSGELSLTLEMCPD